MIPVIAELRISPSQIRFKAEEAINGFATLSRDDAASHAKAALIDIIEYIDALDRADNSIPIFAVREANAGIRIKSVGPEF